MKKKEVRKSKVYHPRSVSNKHPNGKEQNKALDVKEREHFILYNIYIYILYYIGGDDREKGE